MIKQSHWLRTLGTGVLLLVLALAVVPAQARPDQPASAQSGTPAASLTPIQHIIIIDKENRTFDNYFGTFPGADGATTYKTLGGYTRKLNHQPDNLSNGIAHTAQDAHLAYDGGKMDKFSQIPGAMQNGVDEADAQLYQSDIPNYWRYASAFTLADRVFSMIMGPSFPNHLFSIAIRDNQVDNNPAISDPTMWSRWGCDAPAGTTVEQRFSDGTTSNIFPCFNFTTLGDLLTAHNISWKYYAPAQDQSGYQWSAYNAIAHIRQTDQWAAHVVPVENFAADAASGNLPAVSWLVEDADHSEHAPHSVCIGENWSVQQINAIMQNPALWQTTAIILTWDDFGGMYDHVPPPQGPNPQIEYGFRVPTILISPYAKPGHIDHTTYSFPAMLKFVEANYGLPPLGALDKVSPNMFAAFNFSQAPLPPLILTQRTCPPIVSHQLNYADDQE
ncbi:MAG: alkaline phosphatase family protein [Anaerolineae bacterium]